MTDFMRREMQMRGIDAATRTAVFVAATEAPVPMGYGPPEVLRMAGADLTRYQDANRWGPFLDAHNRGSVQSIIGKARAEVAGNRLMARVTFDTTPEGEGAWARLNSGSLTSLSIGYAVDQASVRRIERGQSDGEGCSRVEGPASVVGRWTLLEISAVPVPADRNAVLTRGVHGAGSGAELTQESVLRALTSARADVCDGGPMFSGEAPSAIAEALRASAPVSAPEPGLTAESVERAIKGLRS